MHFALAAKYARMFIAEHCQRQRRYSEKNVQNTSNVHFIKAEILRDKRAEFQIYMS